ncbi:MAG: bacteriophage adsorption protein [Ramlibacter sp.]|nr:bacteriophage adsorption protein [Ramlibacter sp.]
MKKKTPVSPSFLLASLLALFATSSLAQFQGPEAAGGASTQAAPAGADSVRPQARSPRASVRPARPARVARPVGVTSDPAYIAADAAYKAYGRRDYAAAVTGAREATRLAPRNRAYWQLLVNALIAANRSQDAEQALDQGLQASGNDASWSAQRETIHRAMAQAAGTAMYRALEAGDVRAAAASARAAVGFAPDNAAYRLILIDVLLRDEQFAEAEKLAGEAVALLPESAVPLALRAYARQRQGRWDDARADFDRALQQRGLTAQVQRNLRLIAADSALAARDPQRAIGILQGLPDSDAAVAQRRAAANRLTIRTSAQPVTLTGTNFPPPGLDCGAAESAMTCALLPGQPARDPAYDTAAAAYRALEARDYAQAAQKAAQAVAISPRNRDYQLLLLEAQLGAGNLADAEQAATAALALEPGDASLLAQRGSIRKRLGNDAGASEDFNAALATGQLTPVAEIGALADLGRKSEARSRFAQLQADGQFQNASDLDMAYLAARIGDDQAARESFARADVAGKLPETALQDSAYASLRAGRDSEAVGYFKRTIDAADSLKLRLEPQLLFDTRRAVAEIMREGGVIASLIYRGGGSGVISGFGATPGVVGSKTAQVGVEAYWRPFGYRNGRYVELFARGFETLYSQAGGATGGDSLQTALGIRWKPFSEQNAVVSLSRVFTKAAEDDWLAQAAYSLDLGTDLRVDVDNWWTTRVAAEAGRYVHNPQTYGLASVQFGKSYRMAGEGKTVMFPHAVAAAEYNSLLVDKLSVGAGPGVSLRHWFREDKYAAPRSYVDFSLQYRFRLSGDERAKGLFLTSLISY